MKTSVKLMSLVIMTTLGIGGLAKMVSAQPPAAAGAAAHPTSQAPKEPSDGDGETNDDTQDPQESARLQALAKITPEQAQKAAEATMGKPADKVEIENDGGDLVYAVSFGQQDVKVDAGNGAILYTDNQQDSDHAQAQHPRSSIQISGTDAGDGDGETNDDG
jgi:uncharacterized membrane protein YkoI